MFQTAINLRKSSEDCERVIENGICFIVCHGCGWVGIGNTISKDLFYPHGNLRRYPKAKCPDCK